MACQDHQVVGLTDIEKEVVVLKAIQELIDSILNFEVLTVSDSDPAQIHFPTETHAKFFNLVLVDLLSKFDRTGFIEPKTYLSYLVDIATKPHFNVDASVNELAASTKHFKNWLESSLIRPNVWLPSIETKITLNLTRFQLIKIGGNICRHNFLRAVGIARDVQKILAQNGANVTLDEALLVLTELNEWLHEDMFLYHSSTIAEFLNNIRWGIYTYLRPERSRSIVMEGGDPPKYRYTHPRGLENAFAKRCYWDLMNEVRSPPNLRRFEVTEWLKKRY